MQTPIKHIVFATDFSACSFKAFTYALAWTKVFEAQLTIVHVVSNYASLDIEEAIAQINIEEQIDGSRERLRKYVSWGESHAHKVHSELLLGVPAEQIWQFALAVGPQYSSGTVEKICTPGAAISMAPPFVITNCSPTIWSYCA